MNDMIETTALVVYRELPPTLTDVYIQQGGVDAVLALIERQAREEAAGLDASRPKDREKIASLARTKIARSKTALLDAGMKLTEDWRASTAKVNAEKRTITERLDRLRDEIRAPLTAWENAEKDRVAGHEAAIAEIEAWATVPADWTAAQIADRIEETAHHEHLARDWQEFGARAKAAIAGAVDAMHRAHAAAVKREAEAAELARLREADARRERERQEQERIDREARIAAESAEKATRDAESKAAEEAAAAERRAQAERDAAAKRERDAAEALARAEREKIEAEERAKEAEAKAERDRLAAEQKAERDRAAAVEAERRRIEAAAEAQRQADELRAANTAHRSGINRKVLAAIMLAMSEVHTGNAEEADAIGKAIVTAIAKGAVPHTTINY